MGPFEDLLSRLLTYSETQKVGHPIMSYLFCSIGLLGGVVYPSIEFQGVSSINLVQTLHSFNTSMQKYPPNNLFHNSDEMEQVNWKILFSWNSFFFLTHKKKTRHHLFTVSISHKALGTNGEFSHIKGHQFVLWYSRKNVASICLFFMCIHTWILIALKSSSSSAHWEWEVPNEYAYNVKNNQNNIQSPLTVQAT